MKDSLLSAVSEKKCYFDVVRADWKILNTVLVAAEVTDHTGRWDSCLTMS